MKVWAQIAPDSGGDFTATPGNRYAALVSASLNFSLTKITDYLTGRGFSVTYAWEQGTPTRGKYAIDDWLAKEPPDTTDNHRWVYLEGDYTGTSPLTVGQDAPWPLTVYSIATVFEAIDAPDAVPQPPLPPPMHQAPAPARWPWAVGGLAIGGVAGWFFG